MIDYYVDDTSRRATKAANEMTATSCSSEVPDYVHYPYGVNYVDCYYRDPITGNRCSVGRHIPDEKYSPKMEGNSVGSALIRESLPEEVAALGISFLSVVQKLHDTEDFWSEFGLSPMDCS